MSPLAARDPNETEREAARGGEEEPLLTEIDHVGIAVRDLGDALDTYREAFGALVDVREDLDDDGVEVAMLKVAESHIQLLSPTREDSTITAFLEERGEGLHHVAFRVRDCEEVLAILEAEGHQLIDPHPRRGARGARVAFVHPRTLHGTLILLVEEGSARPG